MKKQTTKRALLLSALSLVICVAMLVGTTFAWFTDSVTSANNIIKSGNLDVEMYWANGTEAPDSASWKDASSTAIFDYSLWEPGYTEVRHIKIANEGSLALKYQLRILANGKVTDLADVIDVYYLEPAKQVNGRADLEGLKPVGTLTEILAGMPANASGDLIAEEADVVTLALKMKENAGNEYQGKEIGSSFSVQLLATQLTSEFDSFDNQYDKDASYDDVTMLATKDGEKAVSLSFADFCESVNAGNDYSGWTITLHEDIDFGGAEWTPIGMAVGQDLTADGSAPFSGIFDGNGHTLSNFRVTEGVIVDGNPWLSLFTGIYAKDGNTAGVKNLTLSNVTYDNPNGTIGAIVNVADSDGASALEFSNINISGTIRGFGYYGDAGLATLMYGNEVVVENVDLDLDIIIPADFTVAGYKFISPLIGQISLKNNGHITLNGINWEDCNFYYPSTFKLEDRSTVIADYNAIWVYNTLAGTRVLGCGGYSGQFYDKGVTYTIDGVDYTHADLKKGQKDTPGYMYDYIIRPDAFNPYVVVNDAASLKSALKLSNHIVLASDITVTEDWDRRYTGSNLTKEVIIDGAGHTLKFTGNVHDGLNYHCAFRFEAPATVKNITFDMSEVLYKSDWLRAISSTNDLTVDNCAFIGSDAHTKDNAIVIGDTNSSAQIDADVVITNCTFTNWRRGVSDNENAKEVKSIKLSGNTFNSAPVYVSAFGNIEFTGNKCNNGRVSITSYTNAANVKVVATNNTLDASANNAIGSASKLFTSVNVNAQEGFIVSAN